MDISLAQIANSAAGFYFLLHDNSQVASVAVTSNLRLIFINVPKGPVNSLVYIQRGDTSGFKEIFGDINRKDERNGNFSIRTCLWALENGPILVCNLRSFDDTKDLAGMIGLSSTLSTLNSPAVKVPYQKLFNTERLWWNDPKQLLRQDNANWFNLANVGSQDLSVFVRKSTVKGYDVPMKTWYETLGRELPLYVNPSDYVSETLVDVYIFKTNFGDNQVNMANENYGYLFDENGLLPTVERSGMTVDALDTLATIADAQYIGKYTGSLIPGMLDASGNTLNVQLSLNGAVTSTGLFASFDEANAEELGDWEGQIDEDENPIYLNDGYKRPFAIDVVGHSLFHVDDMGNITKPEEFQKVVQNILSYSKTLKCGKVDVDLVNNIVKTENIESADRVDMTAFVEKGTASDKVFKFYILDAVNVGYGERVVGLDSNLKRSTKSQIVGTKTIIEGYMTSKFPLQPNGELYPKSATDEWVYPVVPAVEASSAVEPVALYSDFSNMIFRGDTTTLRTVSEEGIDVRRVGDNGKCLLWKVEDPSIYKEGMYLAYTGENFEGNIPTDIGDFEAVVVLSNSVYEIIGTAEYNGETYVATLMESSALMYEGNTNVQFDPETDKPLHQVTGKPYDAVVSDEQLAELRDEYGKVYNLVSVEVEDRVAAGNLEVLAEDPDNTVTFTLDNGDEYSLLKTTVIKFNPVWEDNYRLQAIVLPAYKARKDQFTNGTNTRQSEILDIMNQPNIVKGLKNSLDMKPRYLVDAFKTFIEPSYKYQYGTLVQELSEKSTVFCRAILNEAFVEDMLESVNPYFRKDADSSFSTEYIETGGNQKIASSNTYSKSTNGSRYCFFFGPGLKVNHYGQEVICPPAGVVSKAFLDKYSYNFPYTIVANKTGILTAANMTGVEFDFDQDDRGPLERVGYNAIIEETGTGVLIYGNNTAQYQIKTSMSKIHVSELVAFIQEQMLAIMKDYIFKYNDYQNRLEIKKRADAVMNQILDNGGVQYFQNVCDDTNNTTEIIENDMGILDTIIVPARGMERMVHRTYLETAGNITGFEVNE